MPPTENKWKQELHGGSDEGEAKLLLKVLQVLYLMFVLVEIILNFVSDCLYLVYTLV